MYRRTSGFNGAQPWELRKSKEAAWKSLQAGWNGPDKRRLWDDMDAVNDRLRQLEAKVPDERRHNLDEVLAEIRPLGGVEQRWRKGRQRAARDMLNDISRSLPHSWQQRSRDWSELTAKTVKRGFYDPNCGHAASRG